MNGERLAAYKFSTLHKIDQKWIIDRLSPEERCKIKRVLKELDAIKDCDKVSFEELMSSTKVKALSDSSNIDHNNTDQSISSEGSDPLDILKMFDGKTLVDKLDAFSPLFLAAFFQQNSDLLGVYLEHCDSDRADWIEAAADNINDTLALSTRQTIEMLIIESIVSPSSTAEAG